PPTPPNHTLSLHDALPISIPDLRAIESCAGHGSYIPEHVIFSGWRTATIDLDEYDVGDPGRDIAWFILIQVNCRRTPTAEDHMLDRKSTRLNSSHLGNSYA